MTYQDVVLANLPTDAWALTEASGATFAPYTGVDSLTGVGVSAYQQASPFAPFGFSVTLTNGKLTVGQTLFRGPYWCQEAWFKPSGTTSATNRLLLSLGANLVVAGSALYLPTGTNALQFLGGGVNQAVGYTLPTSSWTFLQWGNITGNVGQVDVAVNGSLIYTTATSGFTGTGGVGFGGDPTQASTYAGGLSFPATYNSQQSGLNWYSRYLAATDPIAAAALTLTASAAGSALLQLILAAVRRTY